MAQLPPKAPSVPQKWPPTFSQHLASQPQTHQQQQSSATPTSWVDEFLDFTSAKRGTHRRSMSDSIAFLETSGGGGHGGGFDRLDDEQLMSMFSDDISGGMPGAVGPPSSPSDQNSNNDEKDNMSTENGQELQPSSCFLKSEPGEVESDCNNNINGDYNMISAPENGNLSNNSGGDPFNVDPKRIKRILANRQSAQRSRVRKLQYISELERSVTSLQTEVSALSPSVAFLDHQRLILNVDNSALKQRIAALAQDKIFKDAHQEALKKEIERLTQIYHHQQNNFKMGNAATTTTNCGNNATNASGQPPVTDHNMVCADKGQLMT